VLHKTLQANGVTPLPPPKGPVRERNGCAQVYERDETKLGAPKSVDKVIAEAQKRHEQLLHERQSVLWRLLGRLRLRRALAR
jgi:hypothetical protein